MTFEEYLQSKKIDAAALAKTEAALYDEWRLLFDQVSPASFTSQKLYLINPIRRKYPLKETEKIEKETPKPSVKPVFKPKIK